MSSEMKSPMSLTSAQLCLAERIKVYMLSALTSSVEKGNDGMRRGHRCHHLSPPIMYARCRPKNLLVRRETGRGEKLWLRALKSAEAAAARRRNLRRSANNSAVGAVLPICAVELREVAAIGNHRKALASKALRRGSWPCSR